MDEPETEAARGRRAALAGHLGDAATARQLIHDPSPVVRARALGGLARTGKLAVADLLEALRDPEPAVRQRACELAATRAEVDLQPMLNDEDAMVVETAAWALGERAAQSAPAVATLARIATGHDDPQCREAAVAALGAIGDEAGLAAILAATGDRPAVRRRAVIALAPFGGPEVEAALRQALDDRDWQVRQAAEELTSD